MTAFNPKPMSALLEQLSDPVLKQQIMDQYYADIGAYASGVQSSVFEIGLNVNSRLTEEFSQNRTAFGDMNAIVATLVDEVRGSRAATAALGDMFQSFGERLTDVEATVASHTLDIESFKRSRQQSIEDRQRLTHDSGRNYEAIMEVSRQLESLTARVTRYDHLMPKDFDQETMIQRLIAFLQQDNGE